MVGKGGEAAASAQHKEEHEEDGDMVGVVKLISAEGFEFVIDKKAAMVSNTLRNMLTSPGGFAETREGEVRFPEISTAILEKICQYFYWSLHYARSHALYHLCEVTSYTLLQQSRHANNTCSFCIKLQIRYGSYHLSYSVSVVAVPNLEIFC
ncbi:hypothetical protein CFC21_061320 [Triticum aestivum]|uniref:Elongin-C n=2 Tax=Triticum aestivum TaxID=4565 RepID=A0A9R1KGR9_WHEAT|nr:hypothetical protein CFC21_061320 [Triticum aestivum]